MKLRSVHIRNYRPFRDAEVDLTGRDGHIHIIEGPQGAGKTSFHRAIQWALYGDTPAPNYRKHWNDLAAEQDEEMQVQLKLTHQGESILVRRELDIESANHEERRVHDDLIVLKGGEQELIASHGQDWINSTLPEDLSGFFFLDGEEIQDRVTEGEEIKEDIETVLKHTAILNARDDLQTLLDDRYNKELTKLEKEISERQEITEQIKELDENRGELISEKGELEDELEEAEESLKGARRRLEERNEEAYRELNSLEDEKTDLLGERLELQRDLIKCWSRVPYAVLSNDINALIDDLKAEVNEIEEQLMEARRGDMLEELIHDAEGGTCPICGSTVEEDLEAHMQARSRDEPEDDLERRKVECNRKVRILDEVPELEQPPAELEEDLAEIRDRLAVIENNRGALLNEIGGAETTDKGDLERSISQLEDYIEALEDDIVEIEDDLNEIEAEINDLEREKRGMAGTPELDELEAKIEAAENAKNALRGVREEHIQRKRAHIKEHMNEIFKLVSQSEFIRGRYQGIDFKGDSDSADEYVLQLIKQNGEPKDMTNRPPSAGETQLTALSFVFGLNKYANYSTTIVFDTVAGRLDLANSHAQGEFFNSLDEPIVLLVTDAELYKLADAIDGSIGAHYMLRPIEEEGGTYSQMEEEA